MGDVETVEEVETVEDVETVERTKSFRMRLGTILVIFLRFAIHENLFGNGITFGLLPGVAGPL